MVGWQLCAEEVRPLFAFTTAESAEQMPYSRTSSVQTGQNSISVGEVCSGWIGVCPFGSGWETVGSAVVIGKVLGFWVTAGSTKSVTGMVASMRG